MHCGVANLDIVGCSSNEVSDFDYSYSRRKNYTLYNSSEYATLNWVCFLKYVGVR